MTEMNRNTISLSPSDDTKPRKGTFEEALGLIKTDIYYTDEMVKQIIWEEKAKKYGLEHLLKDEGQNLLAPSSSSSS